MFGVFVCLVGWLVGFLFGSCFLFCFECNTSVLNTGVTGQTVYKLSHSETLTTGIFR